MLVALAMVQGISNSNSGLINSFLLIGWTVSRIQTFEEERVETEEVGSQDRFHPFRESAARKIRVHITTKDG